MAINIDTSDEEMREEEEPGPDFWSDEGARRFNEALAEGSAYLSAQGNAFEGSELESEDSEGEYRDPELYDPNEETLPPGEMELIFENCYIM